MQPLSIHQGHCQDEAGVIVSSTDAAWVVNKPGNKDVNKGNQQTEAVVPEAVGVWEREAERPFSPSRPLMWGQHVTLATVHKLTAHTLLQMLTARVDW